MYLLRHALFIDIQIYYTASVNNTIITKIEIVRKETAAHQLSM